MTAPVQVRVVPGQGPFCFSNFTISFFVPVMCCAVLCCAVLFSAVCGVNHVYADMWCLIVMDVCEQLNLQSGENIPAPTDPTVFIELQAARTVAVFEFGGFNPQSTVLQNIATLDQQLGMSPVLPFLPPTAFSFPYSDVMCFLETQTKPVWRMTKPCSFRLRTTRRSVWSTATTKWGRSSCKPHRSVLLCPSVPSALYLFVQFPLLPRYYLALSSFFSYFPYLQLIVTLVSAPRLQLQLTLAIARSF
jgi:hypothetical protein